LSGDTSSLQTAASKGEQSLVKFVNAAKATTGGLNGAGTAAIGTSRAMALLSPQITDIVTSLQAGQNPLTVFIQQGGQIKDVFGGIGPALRGIGSLITPLSVGLTAAAAAGGSFVYAMYQGAEQSARFRDAMALTGGALGITEGGFNSIVAAVSKAGNVTVGTARDIAQGLASTGKISGAALTSVSAAASRFAELSGKSSEEAISDFASMADGVARWATKHNESLHFATAAQLDYIRQLEETGQSQKAMIEVGSLLIDHWADQRKNLGYLEGTWKSLKGAVSETWDAMLGLGRTETVEGKIGKIQARLKEFADANPVYRMGPAAQDEIAGLQAQLNTLNRDALRSNDAAAIKGANALAEQDAIARREKLRQVTEKLSGVSSDYAKTIRTIQEAAKAGDITEQERLRLLTETATLFGKPGAKGKTSAELQAEQERQYRGMVDGVLKNRPQSLAEIEAKGYEQANRAAADNMRDTAESLRKRNEQVAEFGFQMLDQTQQINISLISDDRARGEATISLDRDVMQRRLDLLAQQGADITQAQEQLNANIVARQRALNEQLMPQYQKNLRDWKDTQRLMYDSTNSLQDAWLRDGEDAWVKFAQTGKLSVKSLVDDVLAEMARLQFRQSIAGPLSSLLSAGINTYFGGGGTGITNDSTGSLVDNGLGAGRANGGPVYPRTLHPINENGSPELLTTSKGTFLATGNQAGYVTPLRTLKGSSAGQGGGAPVVNVNIEGAPNGAQVSSQPNDQGGTDILVKVIQQAKNAVADDIQSGGGVARAMQGTFGLRRATPARA
jgi:phage-related minor tail protein